MNYIKFKGNLLRKYRSKPIENSNTNKEEPLSSDLKKNIERISTELGNSDDLVIRKINLGGKERFKAVIFFIDGIVEDAAVHKVVEALLHEGDSSSIQRVLQLYPEITEPLIHNVLEISEASEVIEMDTLFHQLLTGNALLLMDGINTAISIGVEGWEKRSVEEPQSQTVVKGPRDGFTEDFRTNTSLIRRRIKSPDLWIDSVVVGRVTKTKVGIAYIKGIVNDKIVDEVHERIERINIDSILESGNIEELIEDQTLTPFPTINNSERPDTISAGILEGRVAIIVDGSPFVLLVPALITDFFQSAEDYYQRADIATLIRVIRYVAFFIALLGPSIYIAILTFHQEMVPTPLLISIAAQREGVPFPAFIEALLMEVTFEILREAGIRMPRAVGQAMSIVGALVLGTAAVEAGFVSSAMVIVVAITAISNFVLPAINMAISVRMIRFIIMIGAAAFGLFGIIVCIILFVLHLCSLRSFGVPYTAPMAPFVKEDQKDAIFRLPKWALLTRPRLISQQNNVREKTMSRMQPKA
ncbi:spore germination protein [Alkalihalobacterium alkalinitrilicum]|uniref:spore germination protein n=1 Tax=Alkalihalobacterium alkalinitrilicum TaxID=427920 RepID=UPI0009958CFB|nr:spore germination protein [Alkalihalobacterium alkalinitrilicum]